jgi:hypothetical protein
MANSDPRDAGNTRNAAEEVIRKTSDLVAKAGDRAEATVSDVGKQIQKLAGTIRQKAPEGGPLGSAVSSVADGLDAGGRFLEEENLAHLTTEITDLIRRYPLQSVLAGVGIGFLMARALRSRS